MKNATTFILCLMLCIVFMLSAFIAWASYMDILAAALGVAGFIAGYFAGQELEPKRQTK